MQKTKIRQLLTLPRLLAILGLGLLVTLSIIQTLHAQAVTQAYASDDPVERGMIVRIKKEDTTKITPLTSDTIDQMHGVVVDSNDAPVTLSTAGQHFFVATIGHFDVLVDTQNGPIAPGDYITISAVSGIGMKAGSKETLIVGHALAGFDGKTGVVGTSDITDSSGAKHTVSIGRVQADINVTRNPLLKATEPNVPDFLRKTTEAIAGKPVPAIRIYLGLLIFVISTIVAGSLLYSGVRSAIISIGRNPLSKKSIIRGLIQVIITGLIIFILGIFGVYLLLKL